MGNAVGSCAQCITADNCKNGDMQRRGKSRKKSRTGSIMVEGRGADHRLIEGRMNEDGVQSEVHSSLSTNYIPKATPKVANVLDQPMSLPEIQEMPRMEHTSSEVASSIKNSQKQNRIENLVVELEQSPSLAQVAGPSKISFASQAERPTSLQVVEAVPPKGNHLSGGIIREDSGLDNSFESDVKRVAEQQSSGSFMSSSTTIIRRDQRSLTGMSVETDTLIRRIEDNSDAYSQGTTQIRRADDNSDTYSQGTTTFVNRLVLDNQSDTSSMAGMQTQIVRNQRFASQSNMSKETLEGCNGVGSAYQGPAESEDDVEIRRKQDFEASSIGGDSQYGVAQIRGRVLNGAGDHQQEDDEQEHYGKYRAGIDYGESNDGDDQSSARGGSSYKPRNGNLQSAEKHASPGNSKDSRGPVKQYQDYDDDNRSDNSYDEAKMRRARVVAN